MSILKELLVEMDEMGGVEEVDATNDKIIEMLSKIAETLNKNSKFGKMLISLGWGQDRVEAARYLDLLIDVLNGISIDIDHREGD